MMIMAEAVIIRGLKNTDKNEQRKAERVVAEVVLKGGGWVGRGGSVQHKPRRNGLAS